MNKTSVYVIFILLLLSAIVYFGDAPERILGTSTALKNEVNTVPFAVARNTKTIHYQKDGTVGYSFKAKRLEHYRTEEGESSAADDNTSVFTLIDAPEIIIYREDEPWYVQAKKGRVTAEDQNLHLWSEVFVKHTSAAGVITTINTEELWIDPIKRLAKTLEPVIINSDKLKMNGIGMEADLMKENLKVLSNVNSSYDPN